MDSSVVIRKYCENDAAELLRMWKESQAGWPMGMSTASGNSPVEFHRNLLQGIEIAHFVAEDPAAGRIVGYCGFAGHAADDRFSDLPLLNVHPEWQKHSIGRKLIAAVIDEAVTLGFRRVNLGTWPGNIYAVGLYKRCGFCWVPETEIYMVNYMPLIRTTPFLKRFFDRNDWYGSYRTDKTPEPDDHTIGSMKVYRYRFEGAGESMTVTIDRNADAVSGIETGYIRMELLVDDSTGLRGFSRRVTCRVACLSCLEAESLEGSVRFEGRHGLTAEATQSFRLNAGGEWVHEMDIDVPGELETPRHGPRPSIASVITLNGEDVTLETGFRTELPVECTVHQTDQFVCPGQPVERVMNVENRLNAPVSLALTLKGSDDLKVSPEKHIVELPAKGIEGFPIELTCGPGRQELTVIPVDTAQPDRRLPEMKRTFCGRAFNSTGWIETDDQIVARNAFVKISVNRYTGRIGIMDARTDSGLAVLLPDAGPPFPFHTTETDPHTACRMDDGKLIITVTSDSDTFRGVTRELTLTLGDSPLIHLSGRITSSDAEIKIPRIRHSLTGGYRHSETLIPTRDGIISHSEASFPFGPLDLPDDPGFYPEKWIMLQFRQNIAGFVWTGNPDIIRFADWKIVTINYNNVVVRPDQPWMLPDSAVYIGPGDGKTIQHLWSDMSSGTPELKMQPLIGFDRGDEPLIICGRQSVRLPFRNRRAFTESGVLQMDGCTEAGIRRRQITVRELNADSAQSVRLTVHPRTPHPVACEWSGVFRTDAFNVPVRVPLILFPGNAQEDRHSDERIDEPKIGIETIRLHEMDGFRMRNGRLSMQIFPGFQGAMTSCVYDGIGMLRSPFPNTGVLGFESPWYGGLMPEVRLTSHEKAVLNWSGRVISARDNRGQEWSGVRLDSAVDPASKKACLAAAMDYLTLPGCPMLATRLSIRNNGKSFTDAVIMMLVFPGIDGRPHNDIAFPKYGKIAVRHCSAKRGVFPFEGWLGFGSEDDAPGLAVVQGHPLRKVTPLLIDAGREGSYAYIYESRKLYPGETFDIVVFLVPFQGRAIDAAGFHDLNRIRLEVS